MARSSTLNTALLDGNALIAQVKDVNIQRIGDKLIDRRGRVHTIDALHITALEEHVTRRS